MSVKSVSDVGVPASSATMPSSHDLLHGLTRYLYDRERESLKRSRMTGLRGHTQTGWFHQDRRLNLRLQYRMRAWQYGQAGKGGVKAFRMKPGNLKGLNRLGDDASEPRSGAY